MILETAAAPPFMKNGYLVGCERTREVVYIDPGDEVDELLAVIAGQQFRVTHILLTHAHVDHVSGVARAKRALPHVPIWLHRDDQRLYAMAVQHGEMFGLRVEQPPPVDRWFAADGSVEVVVGDYEVRALHTPGHCPGNVCLQVGRAGTRGTELFVGDTLFAGSIGRTDLPGGDYETLMRAITGVLLPLGDDAVVHSGHGPDTTIGHERRTNPFLLEWVARPTR